MIKTGFYTIVTKNENERQMAVYEEEQRLRKRMAELNIQIPDSRKSKNDKE
jgi:hypothetical protein